MWALQITVTEWMAAIGFIAAIAFTLAVYLGRSSQERKGLGLIGFERDN
jgi:hypothetical protein